MHVQNKDGTTPLSHSEKEETIKGIGMRKILAAVITFAVCSLPASGYDWVSNPGSGTQMNPYQISEPDQLMAIGSDPNLLDKHFILVNDIIFDPNTNPAHVFTNALIAPVIENGPGNIFSTPFEGTFNGNHHTIYNLTIATNNGEYLGLFGYMHDGTIQNLSLQNLSIQGFFSIGGLIGANGFNNPAMTGGLIEGCHAEGVITGFQGTTIGGLIGQTLDGTVRQCSAEVEIHSTNASFGIGGLIGHNERSSILQCYAAGDILAGNMSGVCGFVPGASGFYESVY